MLKRFAPLVPLALVTLLFGCAAQGPVSQPQDHTPVAAQAAVKTQASPSSVFGEPEELATEDDLASFSSSKPYQLPVLADSILERGMSLIGTRYRFGGTSEKSGFDCSGVIGNRRRAGLAIGGDLGFYHRGRRWGTAGTGSQQGCQGEECEARHRCHGHNFLSETAAPQLKRVEKLD